MKIDWLIQKDKENTIGKKVEAAFDKKPSNVYMMLGTLKDSGLEVLENGLVDTKAKVQIIFGFDKKNTTKIMMENLLKYSKEVYGYDNNSNVNLEGNIIIFKYKDCASVFTYSGNTSESSIMDNINMYVHVIYDFENAIDKEEYKELEKKFKMLIKEENLLEPIKKSTITELSSRKAIFTQRIYNHNVKSVAELIAEAKAKNSDGETTEAVEKPKLEDVKFDELDTNIDIDIDFSDESEMVDLDMSDANEIESVVETTEIEIPEEEYTSEILEYVEEELEREEQEEQEEMNILGEALDLESMIFAKPSVKMNKHSIKKIREEKEQEEEKEVDDSEIVDEDIKLISKKINLKNVSTLVMQLPRQLKKGKDKDTIKIPNYVRTLIPNFIDMAGAESFKEDAEVVKMKTIELDIVNIDNNVKYEDFEAIITVKSGQTFTGITSENISNVEIEENSIARILKSDDNKYSIEIIPVESSEYTIWKKVCNLSLRGTNRKYGVM